MFVENACLGKYWLSLCWNSIGSRLAGTVSAFSSSIQPEEGTQETCCSILSTVGFQPPFFAQTCCPRNQGKFHRVRDVSNNKLSAEPKFWSSQHKFNLADLINKRVTDSDGYQAMQHNLEAWRGLQNCHRDEASSRPSITAELSSHTFDTVEEAIAFIDKMDDVSCHVLVTGSIHLVGAVLTLVQRESNNYNSEIRL